MENKDQLNIIWEEIQNELEQVINPISYKAYIEDIIPVNLEGKKIILKAETEMAANTITNKYTDTIITAIKKCNVGLSSFRLVVDGSSIYNLLNTDDDNDVFNPVPLRKEYTFDSFVVGSSNRFVYAAAKAVAEQPGEGYNPLFIYGGSGLGKTHIVQAIANYITEHEPKKKVLYTTCENFLNEFTEAIARGSFSSRDKSSTFRQHYRNVDILMIDDIQFLAKKTGLQEEFFNTFNELTSKNKQIVLTSDRPPKEIATLEERLRTRFEGGLIADIQPPDFETKLAILKKKAMDKKCPMPDDVLEFLANNSGDDVRNLEGRLNKVFFASKLHEEPVSLDLAMKALHESVSTLPSEKEEITADTVISAVCTYYKIKKEDLLGKGKKAELVKARQICSYLIYDILSLPLITIGQIMGGKDHTTIMYSRDKVESLIKVNGTIAKEVSDIRSIVNKQ